MKRQDWATATAAISLKFHLCVCVENISYSVWLTINRNPFSYKVWASLSFGKPNSPLFKITFLQFRNSFFANKIHLFFCELSSPISKSPLYPHFSYYPELSTESSGFLDKRINASSLERLLGFSKEIFSKLLEFSRNIKMF